MCESDRQKCSRAHDVNLKLWLLDLSSKEKGNFRLAGPQAVNYHGDAVRVQNPVVYFSLLPAMTTRYRDTEHL